MPAPTLSDAHYVHVASAFRKDRKEIKATFGGRFPREKWTMVEAEKSALLEDFRKAIYIAFLAVFVQGIKIINLADRVKKWSIDSPQSLKFGETAASSKLMQGKGLRALSTLTNVGHSILLTCSRIFSRTARSETTIFCTTNV